MAASFVRAENNPNFSERKERVPKMCFFAIAYDKRKKHFSIPIVLSSELCYINTACVIYFLFHIVFDTEVVL